MKILLSILFVLGLAACGNSDPIVTQSQTVPETGTTAHALNCERALGEAEGCCNYFGWGEEMCDWCACIAGNECGGGHDCNF